MKSRVLPAIGAGFLVLAVSIVVYTLSPYRVLTNTRQYSTLGTVDSKNLQFFALRSSQIIYLDKHGYRVALKSDTTVDYIEEKTLQDVVPTYALRHPRDIWPQNATDGPLNAYDIKHEENENERDETIDYNFDLQENELSPPKRPPCTYSNPTKNIILLKTHRTGSTTMANILYRYGDLNNLDFALPKESFYQYYWPVNFSPSFVDKQYMNNSRPHMLVNAKFDKSSMAMLMGKESYVITTLRSPVSHFESSFYSNRLDQLFGLENSTNPLSEFLINPMEYMTKYLLKGKHIDARLNHAVNGQIFNLGLKRIHYSDQRVINQTIVGLSESIDFVLVMEYMDESLVLLKRALCWDLDDVLYFTHRKRHNDYKDLNITASMKEQIRQWNRADVSLYRYFNDSLWRNIQKQDNSFFDEVKELKQKRQSLEKECIEATRVDVTGELIFKIDGNSSSLNRFLCEKMNTNEKNYVTYLKRKARLRFQEENQYVTKLFQELEDSAFINSTSKTKLI